MADEEKKELKTVADDVAAARKEANRERRRRTSAQILTFDEGGERPRTNADVERETYITLNESLLAKKRLTGTITGVEEIDGGNGKVTVAAVLRMNEYKIYIPADRCIDAELTGEAAKNPTPEAIQRNQSYLLSKRLGSVVDFVVKGIDREKKIVVASRKEAMEQLVNETYFRRNLVRVDGPIVQGRIVFAIKIGIIVEVGGVEAYIPCQELRYQQIQDATKYFQVGDTIKLKVLEVEKNPETKSVHLTVSAKQAMEDPRETEFDKYNEQALYVGVASRCTAHGIYVSLNDGDYGMDVFCHFPKNGPRPVRGQGCTVRIIKKDEDKKRLFGLIIHTDPIRT